MSNFVFKYWTCVIFDIQSIYIYLQATQWHWYIHGTDKVIGPHGTRTMSYLLSGAWLVIPTETWVTVIWRCDKQARGSTLMFLVGPVVMRRYFRWNFGYQATTEGVISSGNILTDECLNVSFGQHHCHDDAMIWKHFPCYWSFVRWIHQGIPLADIHYYRDLMFSLLSKQGLEETVEL